MTETMSATLVQLHSCVVAPGECVCELKANYSDNIEWSVGVFIDMTLQCASLRSGPL